jgi:hypothetical protein
MCIAGCVYVPPCCFVYVRVQSEVRRSYIIAADDVNKKDARMSDMNRGSCVVEFCSSSRRALVLVLLRFRAWGCVGNCHAELVIAGD